MMRKLNQLSSLAYLFFLTLLDQVAVWAVVLAAMLPLLVSQQTYALDQPRITTCHDALPEEEQQNYFLPYFATLFAVCFVLPFAVVLFCQCAVLRTLLAEGKRYRHAVWVTALVLLVFIGCLLPSNLLLLLTYADSLVDGDGEDLYVPYMVSLAISTFNSCIDPFIFYYVSVEFREKAMNTLRCRGGGTGVSGDRATSSSGLRSKVTLLSMSSKRMAATEQRGSNSVPIQET